MLYQYSINALYRNVTLTVVCHEAFIMELEFKFIHCTCIEESLSICMHVRIYVYMYIATVEIHLCDCKHSWHTCTCVMCCVIVLCVWLSPSNSLWHHCLSWSSSTLYIHYIKLIAIRDMMYIVIRELSHLPLEQSFWLSNGSSCLPVV